MEMSNTIVIETTNNFGSRFGSMEPGPRIRDARRQKGWSQADLAKKVGVSQVAIKKIEANTTRQSKFLPKIALELGLDLAELDPSLKSGNEGAPVNELRPFHGRLDFPIYASAEGGPGEIIRSPDPVDWQPRPQPLAHVRNAYGLYVVGDSMAPEYRPGDIALINPNLPIIGDEVYIFYAEKDGEARATIKHLRRASVDKWLVSQHNKPRDFELNKREWQWAHRVIGKYSR